MLGEIQALPVGCKNHEEALRLKAYYFDIMGYDWHAEKVKDFHRSQAPIKIITAPARGSKSFSAAPEVVVTAITPTEPRTSSLTWLVGTSYDSNKEWDYVWDYIVERRERWRAELGTPLDILKATNNASNGSLQIVIDMGKSKGQTERCKAVIRGMSSSNEKALQGEHVTKAVLSEAAEHPETIWTKYISTRYSEAILPTTPKPHAEWLHKLIEQGEKDPSLGIEHFHFPKEANPLYDHAKFAREEKMAASRSPTGKPEDDPYFAEQFLGLWVYYTGMVLPFDPNRHVVELDPAWLDHCRLFISTDYGYEDACVALFWAQMPSGALLIFDEIYERHLTTPEFVDKIERKLGKRRDQLDYACGDPKQPQVAHYLRHYGLNTINVNKRAQADRATGHRRLVDLLSDDPERGHPMLYVADCCPKTIAEWKHLRYREGFRNEYGTTAMLGADHAFDAARYLATTMPTPPEERQEENWQVTVARQLRHERRTSHHDPWRSGYYLESAPPSGSGGRPC
jgi:hypothetical protein